MVRRLSILLILLLAGCTVVIWSDNVRIFQDTGIGDDKISSTPIIDKLKEVKK